MICLLQLQWYKSLKESFWALTDFDLNLSFRQLSEAQNFKRKPSLCFKLYKPTESYQLAKTKLQPNFTFHQSFRQCVSFELDSNGPASVISHRSLRTRSPQSLPGSDCPWMWTRASHLWTAPKRTHWNSSCCTLALSHSSCRPRTCCRAR